jgi:SAM-dependent methyltransferase
MKYYDKSTGQLIFTKKLSTSDYWDNRWHINKNIRAKIINCKDSYVSQITKKYLRPKQGVILEGGCGQGHYVSSLVNNGYQCIGVDYAQETVKTLNKFVSELDIRYGDVRKLSFADNFFIGYWSLGVIEHFWSWYMPIAKEMARVLKKDGYLFLTFPHISLLRRIKAKLGFYELWRNNHNQPKDFYQYALNTKTVIKNFNKLGFKLIKVKPTNGIKGIKDEVLLIRPFFQRLYDYSGKNILIRGIRKILELTLSPIAGHSILLIFKKIF